MSRPLDPVDAKLLNLIQAGVPLVERPFAELGQVVQQTEQQVLQRLGRLCGPPPAPIRQISAIFDSKSLGYQTSLVASRVDGSHLDAAAAVINQHPGVSHNYRRNHAYNLWYTLAVPPHSRLGLEKTAELLHRCSGAQATRLMPTLKLFKIGVKFDVGAEADITARADSPAYTDAQRSQADQYIITAADVPMIRVLQQDLPLVERPFDLWAQEAGVSVEQLLQAAQRFEQRKQMRRFSAVLRHRQVGFSANAMGVWVVPAQEADRFGQTAAGFSAVSHCYLRPTYPDWPYSVFTMVHAPSPPQCESVLAAISEATGVKDYAALYSTCEYKKTRVKYFLGDIEQWEAARG